MRKKEKSYLNPRWYRLDNAAKLYPAVQSSSWGALYRIAAYLDEEIDPDRLQTALENTLKRFPMFAVSMRRGFFWYYHELLAGCPRVMEETSYPCKLIDVQDNYAFLFRVYYFRHRISLEIFHSLTDGTGALVFLNTLLAQYLRLQGYEIPCEGQVLSLEEEPDPDEWEDAFQRYNPHARGRGWKEPIAFSPPGAEMPPPMLRVTHGLVEVSSLSSLAKSYHATITEMLGALLALSLDTIQRDIEDIPLHPVKISIPVNMRKFYPTKTLRNFSLFTNPGLPCSEQRLLLAQAIATIHEQMQKTATREYLTDMMASNMAAEDSALLRMVPLFIKRQVIKFVFTFFGDNQFSSTLSNLGAVQIPPEMDRHITRYDLVMGRSRSGRVNCGVISHHGQLVITFSSTFCERTIEQLFFKQLAQLGIHVTLDANDRRDAHGTL